MSVDDKICIFGKRLFVFFAAALLAFAQNLREIDIYDYHLKPPFLLDPAANKGLDVDIVHYINNKKGPFHFRVLFMPRKRLNAMIDSNNLDGLVMGVDQIWFHDQKSLKFLWSPAYMKDEDVIVSARTNPVTYRGPASLTGLRVGFPSGFYYFGISEMAEKKQLIREDSLTEESNLTKLAQGYIDVTIVSRSTYVYLLKIHPEWNDLLVLAKQPEETFHRFFLIPKGMPQVRDFLRKALQGLDKDPAWTRLMAGYQ